MWNFFVDRANVPSSRFSAKTSQDLSKLCPVKQNSRYGSVFAYRGRLLHVKLSSHISRYCRLDCISVDNPQWHISALCKFCLRSNFAERYNKKNLCVFLTCGSEWVSIFFVLLLLGTVYSHCKRACISGQMSSLSCTVEVGIPEVSCTSSTSFFMSSDVCAREALSHFLFFFLSLPLCPVHFLCCFSRNQKI